MADEKFSKKTFGKTYYPITQNEMSNNRFKNFTGDKKFGSREDLNKYHSNLKEKLNKQKVRPSEIAKLDKEFKSRMKRANDDLQYKLSNRAGMKEDRKKQKGTIPDTGSEYAKGGKVMSGSLKAVPASSKGLKKLPTQVRNKMGYMKTGGRVGLKSGGMAKRGKGCEIR